MGGGEMDELIDIKSKANGFQVRKEFGSPNQKAINELMEDIPFKNDKNQSIIGIGSGIVSERILK